MSGHIFPSGGSHHRAGSPCEKTKHINRQRHLIIMGRGPGFADIKAFKLRQFVTMRLNHLGDLQQQRGALGRRGLGKRGKGLGRATYGCIDLRLIGRGH